MSQDKSKGGTMKILLISPPAEKDLMKNARCDFVSWSGCQWWPLILGQLGAFLETAVKDEIKLVDAQAAGLSDEDTRKIIAEYDPDRSVVLTSRSSLAGDITWTMYLRDRKEGARSCMISPFIFNPQSRHMAEKMDIDFVAGEPEKGILAWLAGAKGWIKPEALTQEELRQSGWASKFMAKNCGYDAYMAPSEPWPFIDIMTGRGCSWGKCTFCLWPKTYRQKYITRDIEDVMDEIAWIEQTKIFKGIMVEDDNLPSWRALEFAMAKQKRGLKIPWSCLTRAELPEETLREMEASGLLNLHVGYESGSNKTLKKINKGLTKEQMTDWTKMAKDLGCLVHGDFMIGIDETEAEIHETIDWACKLRPATAQFQIYIPYLGDKRFHDPEHLKGLSQLAYKRFYGDPRNWKAVLKQFGKPRVIGRSLAKVMGGGA
jgi:anaerobic magnesium-protoporphyrin IX monomethyl ester cyclase